LIFSKYKISKIYPAVILIIIAGLVWFIADSQAEQKYTTDQKLNSSQFFADDFYSSLNKLPIAGECDKKFSAGITTHHRLASNLVDQFFRCIQKNTSPKTVILIGPNHYLGGSRGVVTAQNDWQTPFGNLAADTEEILDLLSSISVEINDQAVERDHAVSFIIPYIKYYLPQVKIVPLLLRYDFTERELDGFIGKLSANLNAETIIIGSIDFSHYLTSEQALINDEETKQIIATRDLVKVYQNGDEHYDSAPGIYLILSLLNKINVASTYELNHASSSEFTGAEQNITTYFNWLFY
jgi:hypothetical protein